MNLPPPTPLTDEEYVDNLRVVVAGTLNALANSPATIALVREGVIGIIVHSQGVELIRREDGIEQATELIIEGFEEELGRAAEEE